MEYVFEFWNAWGTKSDADSRSAPLTNPEALRRARSGRDIEYNK
jgi:hypothetical protein